jgi:hypothetical protein
MSSCHFCEKGVTIHVSFIKKELQCGCGHREILKDIDVCSLNCLRQHQYNTTRMFDFLDITFICKSCGSNLTQRVEGDVTNV